jgi:hypothetical protein
MAKRTGTPLQHISYSFTTYLVCVHNILGGPMQHHRPLPHKVHPWRIWIHELGATGHATDHRSSIGGISDGPIPIPPRSPSS